MEIKKIANAGTLESSDIQIVIAPSESGIEIQLESAVMAQFGESIEEVIMETLKEMGVTAAKVNANDKGAIDPVIKSRVQTAVMRAADEKNFKW
ncbi:MAG: citrate lyase acyl carrier protein, partial [Fusobacteriaceae bacterium]